MALEKTKLTVEIETKLNGSDKQIDKVTKSVEDLGDETLDTGKKSSKAITETGTSLPSVPKVTP